MNELQNEISYLTKLANLQEVYEPSEFTTIISNLKVIGRGNGMRTEEEIELKIKSLQERRKKLLEAILDTDDPVNQTHSISLLTKIKAKESVLKWVLGEDVPL